MFPIAFFIDNASIDIIPISSFFLYLPQAQKKERTEVLS
jgi:hypothetical protein